MASFPRPPAVALTEKGVPNGVAGLDGSGKIVVGALPALAITSTTTVGSQAAQLALAAQEGDVAVRTDESKTYIFNGGSTGTMSDWTLLATPADTVLSVAGKTGAVTLAAADVGAASASDVTVLTSRTGRIDRGLDWTDGDLSSSQLTLNVAGHKMDLRDGSVLAPVEQVTPTLKVSRHEKITKAAIAAITGSPISDGAAGIAAIHASSVGLAGSEAQSVGIFAGATNESSAEGENVDPDAAALYALGRIVGGTSSKASAYGIVAGARRDVTTAVISGAEIECLNYTATPEAYQVAGAYPGGKARGIWMIPGGEADSSVGLIIDNPFGLQFDVGIAAGASKGGGKTGAIKSAFIRDDSLGKRSIHVRGEHEEGALVVAKGAGAILLGTETVSGFVSGSGTLLDVVSAADSTGVVIRNTGASNTAVQVSNTKGDIRLATAGAAGSFWVGSAEGDSGVLLSPTHTMHLGRSGGVRAPLRVSDNVALGSGAGDSFGEGVGVVFVANVTTAPKANPTGGGILFVSAGALRYLGSAGTLTTIASA